MTNKLSVRMMTACGIMAAIMCVVGPITIPIGPIPLSLINLVIYLAIYILGARGAFLSYLVYVLLGCFGLPVFSGMQGGLGKLLGPTGGFIIGFFLMIICCGALLRCLPERRGIHFLVILIGTALAYAFGVVWFIYLMESDLSAALMACVVPFIPGDTAKMIIAVVFGPLLRSRLRVSGVGV